MRRRPAFLAASVLVLAPALAAPALLGSWLRDIDLGFDDAAGLVQIERVDPESGRAGSASLLEVREWGRDSTTLSGLGGFTRSTLHVGLGDGARRVGGLVVTLEAAELLTTRVVAGRSLAKDDFAPGAPPTTLADADFARSVFGGEDAAVGRTVEIAGGSFRLVGVVARWPAVARSVSLVVPLQLDPQSQPRSARFLTGLARLRFADGEDAAQALERARTELALVASRHDAGVRVTDLSAALRARDRPFLVALAALAGGLFVLGVASQALLAVAQITRRRDELSTRRALGASPGALARLLAWETAAVSIPSAVVAGCLVVWGARSLPAVLAPELSRPDLLGLDPGALRTGALWNGWSSTLLLLAALTGVAWLGTWLAQASRIPSARGVPLRARRRLGLDRGLVVVQCLCATVLVLGALLLARSVDALARIDLGLDREIESGLVTMQLFYPDAVYGRDGGARRTAHLDAATARLEELPGVVAATAAQADLLGIGRRLRIRADVGSPGSAESGAVSETHHVLGVRDDYFATLGLAPLRGRLFDVSDAERAAVVDEAFARNLTQGLDRSGDVLGARVTIEGLRPGGVSTLRIVGVVPSIHHGSLDRNGAPGDGDPVLYVPQSLDGLPWAVVYARTAARLEPGSALLDRMRETASAVAADVVVETPRTAADHRRAATARQRGLGRLVTWASALALLVAMLGVGGSLATRVASQRRNLGIRAALGAAPLRLVASLLAEGIALGALGIALGLSGGTLLGRAAGALTDDLLVRVDLVDPATWAAAAAILLAATLASSAWPAWRAGRTDPSELLRAE